MYINVTALLVPAQYFALSRMNILGIMCIDIYIYNTYIHTCIFFKIGDANEYDDNSKTNREDRSEAFRSFLNGEYVEINVKITDDII